MLGKFATVVVDSCSLTSLALFSPRCGRAPLSPPVRGVCVCVQFLALLSLFARLTVVNRQRHLAWPWVDLYTDHFLPVRPTNGG